MVSLTNKKLLTQPSSLLKRSSPLILPSAPSAQLGGVGLVAKTETPYRVLIGMYNENLKRATTSTLLPILEDDEYAEDDEGEVSKPVLVINEEAVASEEASSPGKKNSTPTTPVEQMVDYEGDEKLNQSFSSDAGSENDSLSSFSFASSDSYDSEADSIFSSGLRNENMDSKDLLNLDLDSWLNL